MSFDVDPSLWRLQAARSLAWALLLGAWVGLGSMSQAFAAGPLGAFAMMALWLLVLGGCAESIARLRLRRGLLRGLLVCAAVLSAWALFAALHGRASALPVLLAWAVVVALASAAVRACRVAMPVRVGPPVPAAALGAVLAWAWVGDIGDLNALGLRLSFGGFAACALLALLMPWRGGVGGACRAGLFDCSMPGWSAQGWRTPRRRPVLIASLVMLPMMCSLPWMVSLCRGESVAAQTVVGLHFAAMFAPAWLMIRKPAWAPAAPQACATLLMLGALVLVLAPGAVAWWGLVLTHGAAWSVAWAAQLADREWRGALQTSALTGAALNALCVLALGFGLASLGLFALTALHLGFGVAAGLVALAASTHARQLPGRSDALQRSSD